MSKFTKADALAMCRNPEQRAAVAAQLGEKPKPAANPDKPKDKMNKTEAAYDAWLRLQPDVVSVDFHPITLVIGGATEGGRPSRYRPDFRVVRRNPHPWGLTYELHETKGPHRFREKGVNKLKAAARQYREYQFFLVERDEDGDWKITRISSQ